MIEVKEKYAEDFLKGNWAVVCRSGEEIWNVHIFRHCSMYTSLADAKAAFSSTTDKTVYVTTGSTWWGYNSTGNPTVEYKDFVKSPSLNNSQNSCIPKK